MDDLDIKIIVNKLTGLEASAQNLIYDIVCTPGDQELLTDLFRSFKEQIFKIIGKNIYNQTHAPDRR